MLDAATLTTRLELGGLDARINAVATQGGAKPMIAAATDQMLKVWSAQDGSLVFEHDFGASIGIRSGVAFSHDGSQLFANFNGGLAVLDLAGLDLRPAATTIGAGGVIVADPLGLNSYLAVLGAPVALVDANFAVTTAMPGTGAGVVAAAFSPDGSFAVTGDLDGSLAVLDVESRAQYGPIVQASFGSIQALTFLPRTETVVTAHSGVKGASTIAFWNLDPAFLTKKACEVAGRDLTAAEWNTYLPGYAQKPVCPAGSA